MNPPIYPSKKIIIKLEHNIEENSLTEYLSPPIEIFSQQNILYEPSIISGERSKLELELEIVSSGKSYSLLDFMSIIKLNNGLILNYFISFSIYCL